MNLNDFDKYVSKKILDRGYDYYINENILDIEKEENGEYSFEIEGSGEDYIVSIFLDEEKNIIKSHCTCPYDFGDICKHEIASYYYLKDNIDNLKKGEDKLIQVLEELKKDELIYIIDSLTKTDKLIRKKLTITYGKNIGISEYKVIIEKIFKKYTYEYGEMKYGKEYKLFSEIEEVLNTLMEEKNSSVAVEGTVVILEKLNCVNIYEEYEEEKSNLEFFIRDIWREKIKKDINKKEHEELFSKFIELMNNTDEDIEIELMHGIIDFAEKQEFKKRVTKILEELKEREAIEVIRNLEFNLINVLGERDRRREFLEKNLECNWIREIYVQECFENREYKKILEVAYKFEEVCKNSVYEREKLKEMRYRVYKEINLKEEQNELALEFFLDNKFEYYNDLKKLNKENFEMFYENLKEMVRNKNIFIKLIETEKDSKEIFRLVKKEKCMIIKYIDWVKEEYLEESKRIYEEYIFEKAKSINKRNQYSDLCSNLKEYGRIFSRGDMENIKVELKGKYSKKRALIEELNKI